MVRLGAARLGRAGFRHTLRRQNRNGPGEPLRSELRPRSACQRSQKDIRGWLIGNLNGLRTVSLSAPRGIILRFVLRPSALGSIRSRSGLDGGPFSDGLGSIRFWSGCGRIMVRLVSRSIRDRGLKDASPRPERRWSAATERGEADFGQSGFLSHGVIPRRAVGLSGPAFWPR